MSYAFDMPADLIAELRDTARDASISAARTFGFGGSTWDAARPVGTGTQPKVLTSIGTVQALAFRQRPGATVPIGGGTPVLADTWRLIVLAGTIRPGDVITSLADDRYQFTLDTIEPWYDYKRAELTRLRGAVTVAPVTTGGFRSPLWIFGIGAA